MKKLTKIIFSCAAVAAVTAALGTAALAAGELAPEYSAEAGTVTIAYESANEQHTVIIVPKGWTGQDADKIEYVDQDGDAFTVLPVNALADGTYEVRVGGTDGTIKQGEFTVGEPTPGSDRLLGDVQEDGAIDGLDVSKTVNHVVEITPIAEGTEDFKAADVNKDGAIDGIDVGQIVNFVVEIEGGLVDGVTTID